MFILAISNSHGKWSSTDSSQSNRSTWVPHAWFLGRYSTVGDGIIGKTTCHMSPCIGLDQVFADHVLTVIYCIHCIRFISSHPLNDTPFWNCLMVLIMYCQICLSYAQLPAVAICLIDLHAALLPRDDT